MNTPANVALKSDPCAHVQTELYWNGMLDRILHLFLLPEIASSFNKNNVQCSELEQEMSMSSE